MKVNVCAFFKALYGTVSRTFMTELQLKDLSLWRRLAYVRASEASREGPPPFLERAYHASTFHDVP